MKTRARVWKILALLAVPVLLVYAFSFTFARTFNLSPLGWLAVTFLFLLCVVGPYVYVALALSTIARKTNTENEWMAWIPIANVVLMLNIAKKPGWWLLLFIFPVVNIVIAVIVWMRIAKARGKPNWWGILLIVPLVGMIVPGYLAWSD